MFPVLFFSTVTENKQIIKDAQNVAAETLKEAQRMAEKIRQEAEEEAKRQARAEIEEKYDAFYRPMAQKQMNEWVQNNPLNLPEMPGLFDRGVTQSQRDAIQAQREQMQQERDAIISDPLSRYYEQNPDIKAMRDSVVEQDYAAAIQPRMGVVPQRTDLNNKVDEMGYYGATSAAGFLNKNYNE